MKESDQGLPGRADPDTTGRHGERSGDDVRVADGDQHIARVNRKGAERWVDRLHPWIYRSDLVDPPTGDAGIVDVIDEYGRAIGSALWSPASVISLRMLTHEPRVIDRSFWRDRIRAALELRDSLDIDANALRLVHAEADGLPSLIVDRYADVLVVQFLSAGIEAHRDEIVEALVELVQPRGILARDDVPIRRHERLGGNAILLHGDVPEHIEVREHRVRWLASPWSGQKTGAFLDQRENRLRACQLARGRALDCFTYHGGFALQLASGGARVTAVDSSADAIERARENARLNQVEPAVEFIEDNVFDVLRDLDERRASFDTIVLDPPAFAKRRDSLRAALRGYKEINLRAMRLLAPGGHLLTFSCSYHVSDADFRTMLEHAAADAGRTLRWIEWRGQAADHPAVMQIPETAYLKGAVVQAG
jgi:23S rRNA (cytosine1962-C5)-methyltransferase